MASVGINPSFGSTGHSHGHYCTAVHSRAGFIPKPRIHVRTLYLSRSKRLETARNRSKPLETARNRSKALESARCTVGWPSTPACNVFHAVCNMPCLASGPLEFKHSSSTLCLFVLQAKYHAVQNACSPSAVCVHGCKYPLALPITRSVERNMQPVLVFERIVHLVCIDVHCMSVDSPGD